MKISDENKTKGYWNGKKEFTQVKALFFYSRNTQNTVGKGIQFNFVLLSKAVGKMVLLESIMLN